MNINNKNIICVRCTPVEGKVIRKNIVLKGTVLHIQKESM